MKQVKLRSVDTTPALIQAVDLPSPYLVNILKLTKPTGQSIHAVTQAYLQFGQKIDPVIMSRFYELFVNCQQV